MKGIILAGGTGSRLSPLTISVSKQLLPVFDKPMIYYPLSTLIEAGIKDILIITTRESQKQFISLLGDGSEFGINLQYQFQEKPNGIAESFIIGEKFIGKDSVVLILGDNIFGNINFDNISNILRNKNFGSIIFSIIVDQPERYGVIKFKNKKIISITEKPNKYISNNAITGLYYFDNNVINISKKLSFSKRNELEIVDILNIYLKKKKLNHNILGKGNFWLDAGTPRSLLQSSQLIQTIQDRQRYLIGSPEVAAFNNGFITLSTLKKKIEKLNNSAYKDSLINFFL
jgi:glucose-1-phosphate thymidylyltransferase|tara:strand:+ start:1226 stop:2086 length:861 start_codon:yes stop_codon:yes gene_type:complete